jgi:hypothetical protein
VLVTVPADFDPARLEISQVLPIQYAAVAFADFVNPSGSAPDVGGRREQGRCHLVPSEDGPGDIDKAHVSIVKGNDYGSSR